MDRNGVGNFQPPDLGRIRAPLTPAGALPRPELAGVRSGAAAARGPDRLGHARGDRGLAAAPYGSARAAAGLLGPGDRDRAPAALGLWPAVGGRPRACYAPSRPCSAW